MIRMNNIKIVQTRDVYVSIALFLLAAFIYFYLIGNYILFFQETQSLFVFSSEYLHQFLLKPGGLLEYAAKFLTQFYAGKLSGSLLLSVILTLPGILIYFINKQLIPGKSLSLLFMMIPSCLLFLMQANYYHLMHYNLGILLILIYYLFSSSSRIKYHRLLVLIIFPLFYYLAGAYAMIFAGMYVVHTLYIDKEKNSHIYIAVLLTITAVTFLLSWKIIFLQPVQQLIFFPFPFLENVAYRVSFYILCGYIVFYPLICRVEVTGKRMWLNKRIYSIILTLLLCVSSVLLLFKIYNPQTARVVEFQRFIFGEKWKEAISFQETKPSRNLISLYFYNVALSESDQLCDRLFFGSQDFGAGSLVLPWGNEHLNRGAYYYYSIGLMNEAHRWAYEEMVVYGYRPQNIRLLAKTSLINGDYRMARKYINILKRTMYYRTWAKKYEMMVDNPELIKSDPELGSKLKILPKTNFFIQFNEPQNNLPLILDAQPDNRKAFEYYLAGELLTKNVEIVVNNVKKMKGLGYTRIPRHIEEAVLMYYNSTKIVPDLGGLTISAETQTRFTNYIATYKLLRQRSSLNNESMQKEFGDTFWFYFQFK
jgi:hypothetical protein